MPYLVDADFVINALAKQKGAHTIISRLSPQGLAISLVAVGEIYHKAYTSTNPQAYLQRFREFLYPMKMLNLNEPIMEKFAEIRAYLFRAGKIIPDFDIIIAATALHYDLTVLTFDLDHFSRVPDLRIYQVR